MPELRSDPWSWVFPDLLVDIIVLSFCDLWVAMKLKGTAYIPFFPEWHAGFRRKGDLRVSLLFSGANYYVHSSRGWRHLSQMGEARKQTPTSAAWILDSSLIFFLSFKSGSSFTSSLVWYFDFFSSRKTPSLGIIVDVSSVLSARVSLPLASLFCCPFCIIRRGTNWWIPLSDGRTCWWGEPGRSLSWELSHMHVVSGTAAAPPTQQSADGSSVSSALQSCGQGQGQLVSIV